jgi:hypothetical protein
VLEKYLEAAQNLGKIEKIEVIVNKKDFYIFEN